MTRLRLAVARTVRRIDNARYLVVGSDDLCVLMNRAVIWLYSGLPVYGKRSNPRTIFGKSLRYWWTPERGVIVDDGCFGPMRPTPTTAPPAAYAPSAACDLSGQGED